MLCAAAGPGRRPMWPDTAGRDARRRRPGCRRPPWTARCSGRPVHADPVHLRHQVERRHAVSHVDAEESLDRPETRLAQKGGRSLLESEFTQRSMIMVSSSYWARIGADGADRRAPIADMLNAGHQLTRRRPSVTSPSCPLRSLLNTRTWPTRCGRWWRGWCRPSAAPSAGNSMATPPPYWRAAADQGLQGVHLAESVGGQGFGILELAVVLAEFGRGAVPGPFVPSAIASALISAHDPDSKLLAELASGAVIAAYAMESSLTATRRAVCSWSGATRVRCLRLRRRRCSCCRCPPTSAPYGWCSTPASSTSSRS